MVYESTALGSGVSTENIVPGLRKAGFQYSFMSENGSLRCIETGETFSPDQVSLLHVYRFEGQSDPDDMSVVYAIETDSGLRGTVIDAFGTYADPRLGETMKRVKNRRHEKLVDPPPEGTSNPEVD